MEATRLPMTWLEKSQNFAMLHSAKSLRLVQSHGEGN